MKTTNKDAWHAEQNMRALGLLSDLRDGTMQPCEIHPDDWKIIRRLQREMKKEDRDWQSILASVKG